MSTRSLSLPRAQARSPKRTVASSADKPDNLPLVGRLYIDRNRGIHRVHAVEQRLTEGRDPQCVWQVQHAYNDGAYHHWEELDRWLDDDPVLIPQETLEQFEAWALEQWARPDLGAPMTEEISDSTELMAVAGKGVLLSMEAAAEAARQHIELIERAMKMRLSALYDRTNALREQLETIRKYIDAYELYLGVYEDIIQLRDGAPAPADTPISLRQMVLWMAEEAGDPRPNPHTGAPGIDWSTIEDFDEWLLQGKHLDQVLPEPKGVVALRPTRASYFEGIHWFNHLDDDRNSLVYFLIRNGDKVFRVYTSTTIGQKFFPGPEELPKLFEQASESGYSQEKAEDAKYNYERNALILQGLIERTDVFEPMAEPVHLFKDLGSSLIRFIYDAEPSLGDGHPSWDEWRKAINAQIRPGSRVVIAETVRRHLSGREGGAADRLSFYTHRYYAPPKPGIYSVEEHPKGTDTAKYSDERGRFTIFYNPDDEVASRAGRWGRRYWDYHARKRRLRLTIYRHDEFVLNYDAVTLEDIEYYLSSRIHRGDYVEMMPLLYDLRDLRLEEIEWERGFVSLLAARTGASEAEIWQAVEWWKHKVKVIRPLTQDDAKALRMIEARVRRQDRKNEPDVKEPIA